jgi:hypothetical protein
MPIMAMRTIRSFEMFVVGSALASALGGCDAGNTNRVLSVAGSGNAAGNSSNGGSSPLGGITSDVGGDSNRGNTGGATTVANTGGASNQDTTGGSPNAITGGAPNAASTGGTPNQQVTGGTTPVSPATGGAPTFNATGGAPATGGATSSAGSSSVDGSYYVGGVWSGYMWDSATGTGSTITPADFTSHAPGTAFCVSGSVGPMADYSGVALLGFNINQAKDSTTLGTWMPASISSGGVTVSVSNNGTSVLRVQIQGPNGSTDATDRWCATMITFNQTVTIPWSSFNTSCWDGLGTRYAGQPLQAVMILVPGDNLYTVPYSFCLNSFSG